MDVIVNGSSQGLGPLLAEIGLEDYRNLQPLDYVSFDWDIVLRRANGWSDRVQLAAGLPDYEARTQSLTEVMSESERLENQYSTPTS